MSITSLATITVTIALVGLSLVILGWGLGLIVNLLSTNKPDLQQVGIKNKLILIFIIGGGFCFAIALILIITVGIWWCFDYFFMESTPGNLAIFCIVIGPAPLLMTLLAGLLAKVVGGSVDASGAKNCTLLGIDIAPLIYTLFMFYQLSFITIGLAILGLMGSGIWALSSIF